MRKMREKRRQKLSRQRERAQDEGVGVDDSDAGFVMLSESLFFNSEAGKELRLTSPLASRSTAANCSADFIKCAGDGKPHFIKCGFGEAAFCGEIAMRWRVAC